MPLCWMEAFASLFQKYENMCTGVAMPNCRNTNLNRSWNEQVSHITVALKYGNNGVLALI
jgi:hypothetical protein